MRVAVTTPTGNIGRIVAERLVETEAVQPVLLARDPAKVAGLAARGAEVRVGSTDDVDFVVDAVRDVDSLFWLTPPTPVEEYADLQRRFGAAAAAAVRSRPDLRVVHLSSVGAQHAEGNGPVDGLHEIGGMLDGVATDITHLRPGYFMENFLHQAGAIASENSLFMPVDPDAELPMVATRDIGQVAADRLLDRSWSGRHHVGIHGPTDLSHAEAARILGEALGRTITLTPIPPEAAREAMISQGMPAGWVDEMLELYSGMAAGTLKPAEPRTAETTTPTTLAEWAREALAPAVAAAS